MNRVHCTFVLTSIRDIFNLYRSTINRFFKKDYENVISEIESHYSN